MSEMFKVFTTNLGKYNEGELVGEWVSFPCDEDDWNEVLKRIGIDGERYEEYFFTDYESDIEGLHDCFREYMDYESLQALAERLDCAEEWKLEQLSATLECDSCKMEDVEERLDDLGNWIFVQGVDTDEELGEYYANECDLLHDVPDHLKSYFDYEAYGRDIRFEEGGSYTNYGYVAQC